MRHSGFIVTVACIAWLGCASKPNFFLTDAAIIDRAPWSRTPLENSEVIVRFAIVGDRAGGIRPGIFEDAVKKLNLLKPDFVLSVGDYIEGFSPPDTLENEMDEFAMLSKQIEPPFFMLPGNHDIYDAESLGIWQQRFGRDYYFFVYKNVLFLCLNTEDGGSGKITDEQLAYFKKVLSKNENVLWTFLLMHQPLWLYQRQTGFENLEKLIQNRPYTVIAGHHHKFKSFNRYNRNYYKIATTGGASDPIPEDGQYDEIVWVTMTKDGPSLVNLLLSGIIDDGLQSD